MKMEIHNLMRVLKVNSSSYTLKIHTRIQNILKIRTFKLDLLMIIFERVRKKEICLFNKRKGLTENINKEGYYPR